jgi:glucose-1-phosphate thymidylyltransferase
LSKKPLNIIIPMAGYGTRLRPHTWSKPKPLVSVAGKTVLSHVLDVISTAADLQTCELSFIVGYLGDQVKEHMHAHYPNIKTNYYVQEEMLGQTHAIALARQHLKGPTMILFVDTIIDEDMSFLADDDEEEAVIWVKQVEDPRRFGVVEVGEDGFVKNLIEKPDTMENDLAVVGYYYFSEGEKLMAAIDHQLSEGLQSKGEYYIADAITLMIQDGLKLEPRQVENWLDAGLMETVLETNRHLLTHGRDNTDEITHGKDVTIVPPVFIHPSAEVTNSTIGPYTSIGEGCKVSNSIVEDSVISEESQITNAKIKASLVGERAQVDGLTGIINIGDDAVIKEA